MKNNFLSHTSHISSVQEPHVASSYALTAQQRIFISVGSPIRQCCFRASVTFCPFRACSTLAPLLSVLTLRVIFASSLSSHNPINNPYSITFKGICSCCFHFLEGPLWSLLTTLPFRSSLASSSTDCLCEDGSSEEKRTWTLELELNGTKFQLYYLSALWALWFGHLPSLSICLFICSKMKIIMSPRRLLWRLNEVTCKIRSIQ